MQRKRTRFWSSKKGEGKGLAWLRQHVSHIGDDCLIWPLTRDDHGYGIVYFDGRRRKAARAMLELVKGPPPTPEHEAAHECGKGHEGCVNPKHLSWKTRIENQRDRLQHGTTDNKKKGLKRKLTLETVQEIRAQIGKRNKRDIAADFGVTRSTIRQIELGKIWRTDEAKWRQ